MGIQILTQEEEDQQIHDFRNYLFREIAHTLINNDYNERFYNTIFDLEEDLIYLCGRHVVLDLVKNTLVGSFNNLEDAMHVTKPGNDMHIWELPLSFKRQQKITNQN